MDEASATPLPPPSGFDEWQEKCPKGEDGRRLRFDDPALTLEQKRSLNQYIREETIHVEKAKARVLLGGPYTQPAYAQKMQAMFGLSKEVSGSFSSIFSFFLSRAYNFVCCFRCFFLPILRTFCSLACSFFFSYTQESDLQVESCQNKGETRRRRNHFFFVLFLLLPSSTSFFLFLVLASFERSPIDVLLAYLLCKNRNMYGSFFFILFYYALHRHIGIRTLGHWDISTGILLTGMGYRVWETGGTKRGIWETAGLTRYNSHIDGPICIFNKERRNEETAQKYKNSSKIQNLISTSQHISQQDSRGAVASGHSVCQYANQYSNMQST